MRLTKLYLNGFKSFAEPTHLIFERGITAIVGPNGSGKSNIVDAIKWIMGERRIKNLRGSVAEDLIFAGNDNVRRSNIAEVGVLFEDENEIEVLGKGKFSTVEVKRVLYRGERSFFYINNSRVLEKEAEYFFNTSAKLSKRYAIVEQGEVEAIALMSPREIARMIMDAAQVGVFLQNKVDAEAELADVRRRLEEIDPYLSEKKLIRDKLALEVEKKLKYQELEISVKRLMVGINLRKYKELKAELDSITERKEKLLLEIQSKKAESEMINNNLIEIGRELNDVIQKYEDVSHEKGEVEKKLLETNLKMKGHEREKNDYETCGNYIYCIKSHCVNGLQTKCYFTYAVRVR